MGLLIRAGAAALAVLAGACEPQIGRGTYFCGPERLCPPDLACDDPTYTCESPALARPFACPDDPVDSRRFEPDDTLAQAHDLGGLSCGAIALESSPGCIDSASDLDHVRFEHAGDCTGDDPHIEIILRHPVALVPLLLELLDPEERVVASGEPCLLPGDMSGMERQCITADPPPGTYYLRIRSDQSGGDCGGSCHHNQYILDLRHRS